MKPKRKIKPMKKNLSKMFNNEPMKVYAKG